MKRNPIFFITTLEFFFFKFVNKFKQEELNVKGWL